jgi:hypothetical protein
MNDERDRPERGMIEAVENIRAVAASLLRDDPTRQGLVRMAVRLEKPHEDPPFIKQMKVLTARLKAGDESAIFELHDLMDREQEKEGQ